MAADLLSNILVQLIFAARFLSNQDDARKLPGYPAEANSTLTFPQLAAMHGYSTEEHRLITQDGYILTIFRIPRGAKCRGPTRGLPVILMHGLLESADIFIDAGPENGLGYLISDQCYDTWVGNVRGTFYSRDHVTLNPDKDRKFWEFSVDEMGLYDVPATIDYVLHKTGVQQVNYVGFSQGGGTFMIMCSEIPGYCEKARLFIGLSPATRHFYTRSLSFRGISELINKFRRPIEEIGIWEILTKGYPIQAVISVLCKTRLTAGAICGLLMAVLDLPHPFSISAETLRTAFSHAPAGTSTKNAARYGQAMTSEKFVKFDYGFEKNIEFYGTPEPPEYNLTAVNVPVVVIQGMNDGIVDIRDSFWAARQVPHLLTYVRVRDPLWTHMDQMLGRYINTATFPTIRQYLELYSDPV